MLKRRRLKQTISFRIAWLIGRKKSARKRSNFRQALSVKRCSREQARPTQWRILTSGLTRRAYGRRDSTRGTRMGRYYFDLRDSEGLAIDEEGLELQDFAAVQEEAALSLADAARDGLRRSDGELNQISIEVRTDAGLFMRVNFSFNFERRH